MYGTASNFSNLDFANHQIVETPMLLSRRCPHPTRDTFEKCLQYKVIETLRLLSFKQVERMVSVCRSQLQTDMHMLRRTLNAEMKDITLFGWAKGMSKPVCSLLHNAGMAISYRQLTREQHKRAKKAKHQNWKDAIQATIDMKTFAVFKVDNFTHIIRANLFSSEHGSYKLQELITCACKIAEVPFLIPVRDRRRGVEIRDFDNIVDEAQLLSFFQDCCSIE